VIDVSFYIAAFVAGILMFLAPCTLPIVPGYLAFIGKGRVLPNAIAFVVGFSIIFILLGAFAGTLGLLVGPYREILGRGAGVLIILFGLTMLGLRIPLLSAERHAALPPLLAVGRPQSSFLIGALFALGWSPCIGPILGTILLFASTASTATFGASLLAVFSLGLAIPFLLTALFIDRAGRVFTRFAGGAERLQKVGGVVLVLVGLVMALGNAGLMTEWALVHLPFYQSLLNYL
jgi:cytochrome c-type biogenesis protein